MKLMFIIVLFLLNYCCFGMHELFSKLPYELQSFISSLNTQVIKTVEKKFVTNLTVLGKKRCLGENWNGLVQSEIVRNQPNDKWIYDHWVDNKQNVMCDGPNKNKVFIIIQNIKSFQEQVSPQRICCYLNNYNFLLEYFKKNLDFEHTIFKKIEVVDSKCHAVALNDNNAIALHYTIFENDKEDHMIGVIDEKWTGVISTIGHTFSKICFFMEATSFAGIN